ncbi:MAG: class I SAM-dependent methyltransferase [Promethearchaeota archaeon]
MKKKNKNKNPSYSLQQSDIWKSRGFKRIFYNNLRRIFLIGQRLGVHIIPNHYYYPVPDTRFLTKNVFTHQTEHVGIDFNEKNQLELLEIFEANYKDEYEKFPRNKTEIAFQYYTTNGNFRSVDGEVLYCMIRWFNPKRIIEIGSGYSTYCSAQAILKNQEENEQYKCELISIEPYPNKTLQKGFPGLSKLISKKLQKVPIEIFNTLNENDILFIDSSHIVNIGNDVQYEFLEILPRLNKGVFVHIHDVFMPAEYPPEWSLNLFRFYNEQYLLQSFLTFNEKFKVIWGSKFMHLKHPERLRKAFESLKKDKIDLDKAGYGSHPIFNRWPIGWPTSFWIKRIK